VKARLVCGHRNSAKRSFVLVFGWLVACTFAMAQEKSIGNSGTWLGIIINGGCTLDEAFAEAGKCTGKCRAGNWFCMTIRPPDLRTRPAERSHRSHLGDSVTVRGSLEGSTIHVSSLEVLNSIGLPLGKDAPAFSARDQFWA
jgi:hypothetical protein